MPSQRGGSPDWSRRSPRMADDLLDAMADRGADGSAVEFMHDFAYLLPVTVICELIGIPEADREGFRPVARDLAARLRVRRRRRACRRSTPPRSSCWRTSPASPPRRRAEPRDDLISDLLAISDSADGRLTDAELLHNLTLLLVAGFETTTNLLGNGLQIILEQPPAGAARPRRLRPCRRVRGGSAALRLAGAAHQPPPGTRRRSATRRWPTATRVMTMLGAGNRDPRRFAEPDAFRPLRAEGGPLSFGGGAHFCIGAALARLEGSIAFPRLVRRFPKLAAAGDAGAPGDIPAARLRHAAGHGQLAAPRAPNRDHLRRHGAQVNGAQNCGNAQRQRHG